LSPGFVRFGGNEASDYNWKAFTYNAGGDWFFEDFGLNGKRQGIDSVAMTQFRHKLRQSHAHHHAHARLGGQGTRPLELFRREVRKAVQGQSQQSRWRQRPEAGLQDARDQRR
jgi:hypothetical protein